MEKEKLTLFEQWRLESALQKQDEEQFLSDFMIERNEKLTAEQNRLEETIKKLDNKIKRLKIKLKKKGIVPPNE